MNLQHLNELSRDALRAWLRDALSDRAPLPKLTHDEPPDVALLRVEPTLDKPTRRDLASGCASLIREFAATAAGDEDYVRALLHLSAKLQLDGEIGASLATMALRFPELPALELGIKRVVLHGLVKLRAIQPPEFWHAMLAQNADAFAGPALSGLLATSWSAGLALLPHLPERPSLANAAASILDHAFEQLPSMSRAAALRELQEILPRCTPLVREAVSEVVRQYAPGTKHMATSHPRLGEVLRSRFPRSASHIGQPHSARLVAA